MLGRMRGMRILHNVGLADLLRKVVPRKSLHLENQVPCARHINQTKDVQTLGNCSTFKKGGHPFLKNKCLNCGSSSHLKATCNRPFASARDLEAELKEQQDYADDQDDDQADDDQDHAGKGDSKGKGGKGGRGRGAGRRPAGVGRNPTPPAPKRHSNGVPRITEALADSVYFEMMFVGGDVRCASDSDDVDLEYPNTSWVQTLQDEHRQAFQSRGRKACVVCKGRTGLMKRCNKRRHHVHGAAPILDDEHGVQRHIALKQAPWEIPLGAQGLEVCVKTTSPLLFRWLACRRGLKYQAPKRTRGSGPPSTLWVFRLALARHGAEVDAEIVRYVATQTPPQRKVKIRKKAGGGYAVLDQELLDPTWTVAEETLSDFLARIPPAQPDNFAVAAEQQVYAHVHRFCEIASGRHMEKLERRIRDDVELLCDSLQARSTKCNIKSWKWLPNPNREGLHQRHHIVASVGSDSRVNCVACHASGPMKFSSVWVSRLCDRSVPFCNDSRSLIVHVVRGVFSRLQLSCVLDDSLCHAALADRYTSSDTPLVLPPALYSRFAAVFAQPLAYAAVLTKLLLCRCLCAAECVAVCSVQSCPRLAIDESIAVIPSMSPSPKRTENRFLVSLPDMDDWDERDVLSQSDVEEACFGTRDTRSDL
eukprot:2911631-Amphidinium_carterae.1